MAASHRRIPVLAPSIALLLGVWIGLDATARASIAALAVPALLATAVGGHTRRSPGRDALLAGLAAASLAAGLLVGLGDAADRRQRAAAWLGAPHGSRTGHWTGTVAAAPETDDEGGRLLVVVGRPSGSPDAPPDLRLRLRIAPSPPEAWTRVDALRHGDRVRIWCRASIPPPRGNPGAEDPAAVLRARGVDAVGSVKSARLIERLGPGARSTGRAIDALRVGARARLDRAVSDPDARVVLGALLLGDRAAIDPTTWRRLREGGIVHVLAISGLHVSLLVGAGALGLRGVSLPVRQLLLAAMLVAVVLLVGPRPSVLRAVLLAVAAFVARALGRGGGGLNVLAWVAVLVALQRPATLDDVGFHLSFAAVAALVGPGPRIARSLPLPGPPGSALAASIAAYGGTLPVLAVTFRRAVPVAIGINLAAVPACFSTMLAGLAVLAIGDLPVAGPAVATAAARTAGWLVRLGDLGAAVGGSDVLPRTGPTHLLLYVLVWSAVGASARASRMGVAAAVAAIVSVHLGAVPPALPAPRLALLDVGQGQSFVFGTAPGRCAVVDVGGSFSPRYDVGERVVVPALSDLGCRGIDLLVLSHEHRDHAGGAFAVIDAYDVDRIWVPPGRVRSRDVADALALASARQAGIRGAARGDSLGRRDFDVRVVHPDRGDRDLSVNDGSIVVRVTVTGLRVLVAGDLEQTGERRLLSRATDLRSDVLVVAHHGSADATSARFLRAVRPREAWISVGEGNRFGHPSPAVLERLRREGVTVRRTDLEGRISAASV